jgi:serine/threonine protein kinase, bacterial
MLGKLLDRRYQVTQVLGAGGFGKTYLAQDTRRPGNPICVVKQLKPISSDTGFLETARRLFTSEGETLEQLGNHDQIPRLLAYFEEDNEFFLVQEFIEGHTLTEELLPGQHWEESRVIELLTEVLTILEFVHSRGVIHRDIKPDNLIRRNSDRKLVLVDFGAVKQMHTQLTTTYAQSNNTIAVGTPGYMSSEQARGQPRPNSDIYALGVIGIQALTGLVTMQMQDDLNTGEILWEHLGYVSKGLAAIITKMVRYHFKDRYQSATEVLQELKQLSAGYSAPRPQTLPVAPNRNLAASGEGYPKPTEAIPQPTLAATPGSASRQGSIDLPSDNSSSSSLVPILVGLLLASVAGVTAFAVQNGSFTSALKGDGNNQTIDVANRNCTVTANNLNVRSEPGTQNDPVGSLKQGTKLALTGVEQNGWVEVNSPRKGWVAQNLINCNSSQPAAVDEAKATPTPVKKPTPKPSPVAVKPKPPTQSDADKLAKAEEKYKNGDLPGAIAQAKDLIASGSASAQEAQTKIIQWQKDWSEAKAKYDQVQKALDEGRWDEVIRAADPRLLQQSYWRDQLAQLIAEANKQKAAAEAELKKGASTPPENPQPGKSTSEPSKSKSSTTSPGKVPPTP